MTTKNIGDNRYNTIQQQQQILIAVVVNMPNHISGVECQYLYSSSMS